MEDSDAYVQARTRLIHVREVSLSAQRHLFPLLHHQQSSLKLSLFPLLRLMKLWLAVATASFLSVGAIVVVVSV